jgi:hypothetical protein
MIGRATLLALLILTEVAATAHAACYSEGKRYDEGDRVGFLVCVDGKWAYRP